MKKHGKQYSLDEELVLKAIKALSHKFKSSRKPLDLKSWPNLYLGVTFKSIPNARKQIRIRLPHSLYSQRTDTVCLITCFRKDKVKQLLADNNITCVKKVLTINSLRRKYKQFEARRELVSRFDVFLTDSKACPSTTRLLGKIFIQKHKIPHSIHLRPISLSHEIDKAFSTIFFHLSSGSTSSVSIGSLESLTDSQLTDNAKHCLSSLMQKVPPGWSNVRNVFVKSEKSLALPIFTSLPRPPSISITAEKDGNTAVNALPKLNKMKVLAQELSDDDVMVDETIVSSFDGKDSLLDRAGTFERVEKDKKKQHQMKMGGKKKKFNFQLKTGAKKYRTSHLGKNR